MVLSRRTMKWIQNLERFCDVDYKKAVVTMRLHFQSVSEVTDANRSDGDNLVISTEIIQLFENNCKKVPNKFKVDFQITFEDYQGYDPEVVRSSLLNAMDIQKYRKHSIKKKKQSKMGIFLVVGTFLMLLVVLNEKNNWFAFSGITMSMILSCMLEMMFELYFEEGALYFTISKIYAICGRKRSNRVGSIRVD